MVQLAIDRKPWPIFKRFVSLNFCEDRGQLISFNLHSKVHVVASVFES
jgi:hypothetical protein